MSAFHIRTAQAHDMDYIIGLLAEAGWNPGLHDAQCFFASDPQGFLIAHLGEQAIGCVSAVRYPDVSATDFGFIGCYIMQPPWRGQIYGAWLGMHAMKLLHDCNIGIDGVVEQQTHYAHFGFSMAHRNLRYMGDCSTWPTDQSGLDIVNACTLPLAQLVAFDSQYFPAPRPAFLQAWLSPDTHHSLALMQDGQIIAYGTARACIRGYKIGPLFAQDSNSARAILLQLAAWIRQQTQTSSAPGASEVMLDISEENAQALALVQRLDMQFVFETARMYSQARPALNWQHIYGISSFELG